MLPMCQRYRHSSQVWPGLGPAGTYVFNYKIDKNSSNHPKMRTGLSGLNQGLLSRTDWPVLGCPIEETLEQAREMIPVPPHCLSMGLVPRTEPILLAPFLLTTGSIHLGRPPSLTVISRPRKTPCTLRNRWVLSAMTGWWY